MENNQQGQKASGVPAFDIEELFNEAQGRIDETVALINRVSTQVRDSFQASPALGMAVVMAAGFFGGLLLRRGKLNLRTLRGSMSAEPLVLLAAGAVAGYTVGPRLVEDLGLGFGAAEPTITTRGGIQRSEVEGTSLRPNASAGPLAGLDRH